LNQGAQFMHDLTSKRKYVENDILPRDISQMGAFDQRNLFLLPLDCVPPFFLDTGGTRNA
jgi:hypothetical protein